MTLEEIHRVLLSGQFHLATAESCTGGLLASAFIQMEGASAYFDRGFVTYSNRAKREELGVSASLLERYGAVSEEVANAMLDGLLGIEGIQVALCTTGIAGPGGGCNQKPVGTVWVGAAVGGQRIVCHHLLEGRTRNSFREEVVHRVLGYLGEILASY